MPVDWVVVGLDNGGTTNNGTILDSTGRFLLDRMAEVPSEVREGPDKAIHALVLSVEQVLGLTGVPITAVRAVGLDTPGPASADGVISSKGASNCGQSGDAESVASLTGIQNNLLPYWLTRYEGHPLGEVPIGVAAKQVRKYGEDGDEMALAIFRQQAMALGRLFTMAANFLDPDAYFLGGGVVEAAPHFRDWFFAEVRAHTVLREEQVRVAEISLVPDLDMAGARGSAYAARDWLAGQGHQVKPATVLPRRLLLGRRDDHDHGEAGGLIARVLVPVRAAGREAGALARTDLVPLARHGQRQRARFDPD